MQPENTAPTGAAPLEGIVVLDMSGVLGNYCGKLFADLGASVVLIEPPGGVETRRLAPFVEGRGDGESSLFFQYFNTSKRSLVLDLGSDEGASVVKRLAQTAHLLIETSTPGEMARRGLDYPSLRKTCPNMVMTSITPFGQSGPYSQWEAEDIVGLALGGMLYLGGYTDSAPIAAFGHQAQGAANLFGAVASMAAVLASEAGQGGQHIDVAMQESVVMGMENAVQFFDLENVIRKRTAGQQRAAGTGVFPCRDGFVYMMAGGIAANRFWNATVDWLVAEGVDAEALRAPCWYDQDYLATDGAKQIFSDMFGKFAATRSKVDLYNAGQARRIPIGPVLTTADVVQSRQLLDRKFFVNVETSVGNMTIPGAPYKLSRTPWRIARPAPTLGEHSDQILVEAGFGASEIQGLRSRGVVQ